MILILGENESGKSRFAESVLRAMPYRRIYLACMQPYGEEGMQRIQKHLRMREDLQAKTLEDPYLEILEKLPEENGFSESVVLWEDVSNYCANLYFEHFLEPENAGGKVLKAVRHAAAELSAHTKELVTVSISGLSEGDYDGETAAYIRLLNDCNAALYEAADTVIRMQNGCPKLLKGRMPAYIEKRTS